METRQYVDMSEGKRYIRNVVAEPGVNRIGDGRYYCYVDHHDVVVVIPNWYRWTMAMFMIVCYAIGFLTGWVWS
jgi:hypothetical protein